MLQKLQWDSLHSRVIMLYRICKGLVAIPASTYLQPVTSHTRGSVTRYRQIQCNTNVYSHTSFLLRSDCGTLCRLTYAMPAATCQVWNSNVNDCRLVFILCTALLLSVVIRFYLPAPIHLAHLVPLSQCDITQLSWHLIWKKKKVSPKSNLQFTHCAAEKYSIPRFWYKYI